MTGNSLARRQRSAAAYSRKSGLYAPPSFAWLRAQDGALQNRQDCMPGEPEHDFWGVILDILWDHRILRPGGAKRAAGARPRGARPHPKPATAR